MKPFLYEHGALVFLLSFVIKLCMATATSTKLKGMQFMDNYISLLDLSGADSGSKIQKRTSIVDGGVFVPYKSTTIVHKSRLVPVTFGFVINKETLKDNPTLYKLGVKMLDKKVEKNLEKTTGKKVLEPKSNCVKGSKLLLKLLHSLSKDINKLEKNFLPEVESHGLHHKETVPILNKKKRKPFPQSELHESGHKGLIEKALSRKNPAAKHHFFKKWSRYLRCIRRNPRKKCSLILKRHNKYHRISLKLRNKKKRLLKGRNRCKRCRVVQHHHNRLYHHFYKIYGDDR